MVIWLYTHVLKPHFHTNSLKLFYKISDILESLIDFVDIVELIYRLDLNEIV